MKKNGVTQKMSCKEYVKNILIGFDQLVNCFCKGCPDETISARMYRLKDRYWYTSILRRLIDLLFFIFEKNHCKLSYESELLRSQYPKHYQDYLNLLKNSNVELYNKLTNK